MMWPIVLHTVRLAEILLPAGLGCLILALFIRAIFKSCTLSPRNKTRINLQYMHEKKSQVEKPVSLLLRGAEQGFKASDKLASNPSSTHLTPDARGIKIRTTTKCSIHYSWLFKKHRGFRQAPMS